MGGVCLHLAVPLLLKEESGRTLIRRIEAWLKQAGLTHARNTEQSCGWSPDPLPVRQLPQTSSGISGGVTPGLYQFVKLVGPIATSPQILSVSSEVVLWKGEGMQFLRLTWLALSSSGFLRNLK